MNLLSAHLSPAKILPQNKQLIAVFKPDQDVRIRGTTFKGL
jgi:hypothetical protein